MVMRRSKKSPILLKVKLPKWELPTRQPKVLMAQLRTRYRADVTPLLQPEHDAEYKARLFATLEVSVVQKAHFTVFPEYAWPASLVPQLRKMLGESLAEGCACVLPFEHTLLSNLPGLLEGVGLDKKESKPFLEELRAARGGVSEDQGYCNFLLFAVKVRGKLHLVPQAKLAPAAFEEPAAAKGPRRFIRGSHVRLIQGENVSVATAICFDFIARDEAVDVRPREALHGEGRPELLIVPECNPSPLNAVYARGLVALYADPSWARQPPVVLFTNVAAGTQLPGGKKSSFGTSRAFGKLGNVGPRADPFFREYEGVVAGEIEQPEALSRLPHPTQKLLTIRQEESAVCLTLPTLGTGPTRDPEAGRIDTEVLPLRYVAKEERWQQIHHTARPLPSHDIQGIPTGYLEHARLGVHTQAEQRFDQLLREVSGPVWVQGSPGSGKSMLVASRLNERVVKPGLARVVWLDLSRSAAGSVDKLRAGLLLALGKPRALERLSEEQWKVIEQELSRTPTVLVLDSFEWWSGKGGAPLPVQLRQMASYWPGRLVLTTRGGVPEGDSSLQITSFDANQAQAFLSQEAPGSVDRALSDAVHRTIGGLPLALSWVAGMLRAGRSEQDISAGLKAAQQRQAEGADGLEELLKDSTSSLPRQANHILGVLALLPAPVEHEDLAEILALSSPQVSEALGELEKRNLVLRESRGEGVGEKIYGRHPIVHQFGREDTVQREQLQKYLEDWALKLLDQHGGDMRWEEFPHVWRRWENLRAVLGWLAESPSAEQQWLFLRCWRKADYPLWSGGRWRDRAELGRKALAVASGLGKPAAQYEAHAAYDSVAETEWHLGRAIEDVWPLFERAEKLFRENEDHAGLVMVAYYRGRLLRHEKKYGEARARATEAEKEARALKDERLLGLVLNLLAKIEMDEGNLTQARDRFREARECFKQRRDHEMVAIVDRNEGQLASKQGRFGEALDLLERSMSGFQHLRLEVEEAEAANHHAQVLAELGEFTEAEAEFRWARGIIEELGAKVREKEFRQTAQMLAKGRKG
jgi:tetratricopeptide (TPR) repeat protein